MTTAGDVFAALKTQWAAAATLSGLNGPYRDRKPPDTSVGFPYVIVKFPVNTLERSNNKFESWKHVVEFTVYATTPEAIDQPGGYLDLIGAVFDLVYPALADGKGAVIRCKRMSEEYAEEAKNVCKGTLTYEYLRRKLKTTRE